MLGTKCTNSQQQSHDMYFSLFWAVSVTLFTLFLRDGYVHDDTLKYLLSLLLLSGLSIYLLRFAKKNLVLTERQKEKYRLGIHLINLISIFVQINLLFLISSIVVSYYQDFTHLLSESFQIAFIAPMEHLHISWNNEHIKVALNTVSIVLIAICVFKLFSYILSSISFSSAKIYDESNANSVIPTREENDTYSTSLGYFYQFSDAY